MNRGILYLCSECGVPLREVLSYVGDTAIEPSIEYCSCSSGADIYEYTPEEIEELKEYKSEIGTQELNNREKILFEYLGGNNAGKISSILSPDTVEGDS